MKCRDQMSALFDQHRVPFILCQNPYARTGTPDYRGPDEHRFHVTGARTLLKIGVRMNSCHPAVDLPSISIALDSEIDDAEAFLGRLQHFLREKNRSRARAEYRLLAREHAQRFFEVHEVQELQHGRAFPPRYDQAVDILEP